MILSKTQANGIYNTMCEANNFGGKVCVTISGALMEPIIKVDCKDDGRVLVMLLSGGAIRVTEDFASQAAFAADYCLQ